MVDMLSWPLEGRAKLIRKVVRDYCDWMASDKPLPTTKIYRIASDYERDNAEEKNGFGQICHGHSSN